MSFRVLENQLRAALCPGMHLPEPFVQLYDWIEGNKFFTERDDGTRIGFLYPQEPSEDELDADERFGGTDIWFYPQDNQDLRYWFGHDRADVIQRLCVFAQTGGDGSMAAFWLDENGRQRIVHLGSGSGSTLCCVLAENPVDFFRLLAIGYDEICWEAAFPDPPCSYPEDGKIVVHPNVPFQEWVRRTFRVEIPTNALEIVKSPSRIEDPSSVDEFWRWVSNNVA